MYILFDFDGTLIDSFHCVVKHTIGLADQFNFRKINEDDIESLRDLSSMELIRFLNVPIYRIPQLIQEMRKRLYLEMPHLALAPSIYSLIECLHRENYSLGILTSNSKQNVTRWLELNGMLTFFDFIHTESKLFSKAALLKKTLKKYRIDPRHVFYIGDETRDIEAAKKSGVCSVAVTWGYHSEKALLKCAPSFIAHTPDEVLKIIKNSN